MQRVGQCVRSSDCSETKINGNFISAHSQHQIFARTYLTAYAIHCWTIQHAKQLSSCAFSQIPARTWHAKQINIIFYWYGYGSVRFERCDCAIISGWMRTRLVRTANGIAGLNEITNGTHYENAVKIPNAYALNSSKNKIDFSFLFFCRNPVVEWKISHNFFIECSIKWDHHYCSLHFSPPLRTLCGDQIIDWKRRDCGVWLATCCIRHHSNV